jgi:hypothetical protein
MDRESLAWNATNFLGEGEGFSPSLVETLELVDMYCGLRLGTYQGAHQLSIPHRRFLRAAATYIGCMEPKHVEGGAALWITRAAYAVKRVRAVIGRTVLRRSRAWGTAGC